MLGITMLLQGRLVYYPWSREVRERASEKFANGYVPILDLQTSSLCTLRVRYGGCIYCDSNVGLPQKNELTTKETKKLISDLIEHGLEWIFICGLGEPFDDPKFWDIISYGSKHDIKFSVFTNGLLLQKDESKIRATANDLFENNVNLLVKCDSLKVPTFSFSLGLRNNEKLVERIFKFIEALLDLGYCEVGNPDLALSIVPLKQNLNEIPQIVQFCKERKMFPLIGQLEYAGRAKTIWDEIAPTDVQLLDMLRNVSDILGYEYEIPVCPAGIYSIHVNNKGDVVIDENTGLSCFWFYLMEPKVYSVGNIRKMSAIHLLRVVEGYRIAKFNSVKRVLESCIKLPLGGCGGKLLVKEYINFMFNKYASARGIRLPATPT